MFTRMLDTIKDAIEALWLGRFNELMARAQEVSDSGVSSKEAYRQGYRDGYWDGTSDLTFVLSHSERLAFEERKRHQKRLPSTWTTLLEEPH